MRKNGRFVKGVHYSKETEFKKGYTYRTPKKYWDKEWLENEYRNKAAKQIAEENGCTENNIYYWLEKHNIKRRKMEDIRKRKHWGVVGADNPMWNRKGELNPNWKGGITKERQLFYQSREWKNACRTVWKRDNATCQRCGMKKKENKDIPFHIHHKISFKEKEYRADINNLVLVCEICHHFIHSKKNTNNEFLP